MDNDLRIRMRLEPMAEALQLLSQFDEIINLPVENNLNLPVLIPDRLPAATHVNNAEPTVPKPHFVIHQFPFAVRSPMPDDGVHAGEQIPIDGHSRKIKNSTDAAHKQKTPMPRRQFVWNSPFTLPANRPFNRVR